MGSKSGRCVGLTLLPLCAHYHEIWVPQPSRNPQGLYRDDCTFAVAFPLSQCLRQRASMLRFYVNCLSCFTLLFCTHIFTLDAGLLAISQYSEGAATGHLDTGFSWFPCVYKQMLRWFPRFQVAITCFSCSPPGLNLLATNFIFCIHVK